MSKQAAVKPKTTSKSKPVVKEETKSQDNVTDKDEEIARQLQEQMLREQEESDADLARRLHEEEQSKHPMSYHPPPGRPMSATPIGQLFQTMFNLRPEALEVEAEEDEDETPAMEPDAVSATAASGAAPRGLTGVTGATAGRGEGRGGMFGRRAVAGRSPERARRGGLTRSPERPMNRARRPQRASTEDSDGSTPPDPPALDQLPGVRLNPAFRPGQRPCRRRIVLHNTNPPEQSDNPPPLARPIGAMRPLLGEREATMNLPDNEYDPDFMVLDLGANERQREANFINMTRDPFLLMLLLMGRDPGLMIPDDVDLGDYEALWGLAERLGEVRNRGMKEEEINKLPTRIYRPKAGGKGSEETCSICMSEYKRAENVQLLPCNHEYHKDCLLEWLKRNATCPICRQDVKKTPDTAS